MEMLTFEDIIAATEKSTTIPSIPGKKLVVRALDPIELMKYIDEAKNLDVEDLDATTVQFVKLREIVVRGCVTPALDNETVKKVPGRVLMDILEAIMEHSGAGGEAKKEADDFRAE